jgi:tetratricopeptide (TPR) repeat protein
MFWKKKRRAPEQANESAAAISPAAELQIAHEAFARGELGHAVSHLAWALSADPRSEPARELLDRVIRAAREPLDLVPWTKPETPYPIVAVRAAIHARRGQLDEAIRLMGQIYQAVPDTPFLAWLIEWAADAEQFNQVEPDSMVSLIAGLSRKLDPAGDPASRAAIEPLLPALLSYQASHPQAGRVAALLSTLVRKLGRLDQALALAQQAYAAQPDYYTAVMLGGAQRARGELAAAVASFRDALRFQPEDLAIRLDIGDALCQSGELASGLAAYQEVLEREPQHPWALPSTLYYRHVLGPDGGWDAQLEAYAGANRSNERANTLVAQLLPYRATLPEPSDALINLLRQLSEQGADARALKIGLSSLESPSARLAIEQYQIEQYGAANLQVDIATIQRPDPRLPRRSAEYVVWTYNGTDPIPAVRAPAPGVAAVVARLAEHTYDADSWSFQARQIATQVGPSGIDDLLGVMAHPPARPHQFTIWVWIYRVQVAVAFVLAFIDTGWEHSQRKRVLLALANGPLDWTVEAAIIALGQLAREEPAAAAEIGELFLDLLEHQPKPGGVPYLNALLLCALALPSPSPQLTKRVRRELAAMRG